MAERTARWGRSSIAFVTMLAMLGAAVSGCAASPEEDSTGQTMPRAGDPAAPARAAPSESPGVPPLASPVGDSLNAGHAYFFVVDEPLGKLLPGKTYLLRRDLPAHRDIVSSVADFRSIAAAPSTDPTHISLWGSAVSIGAIDAKGVCLRTDGASNCAGHLVTTLFGTPAAAVPSARELLYLEYMERYAGPMAASIGMGGPLNCSAAGCPTGDTLNTFYEAGSNARWAATLLPFVTSPELYAAIADRLELEYGQVRGYIDGPFATQSALTATAAAALAYGLVAYQHLTKDPAVSAYIQEITAPALAHALTMEIEPSVTLPAYVLSDTSLRSVPAFRVLYLDVAGPREAVGIPTLDPSFAVVGLEKLFAFTALGDVPVVCNDMRTPNSPSSPQPMVLGYGGSPHMAAGDDCEQDIHHTSGNILAMLHVMQSGVCDQAQAGSPWAGFCAGSASVLLANLAWVDSLQIGDGSGRMWNVYPSTLRNGEVNAATSNEWASRVFWTLYTEVHRWFPDSTAVKVAYDGRTKPLADMVSAAQRSVDYMVDNDLSYIWMSEYIRAQGARNGLVFPAGW